MDKTKEKVIDIDGLTKLLNEVNYDEIIFSDPSEWTTEQEKALDTLFQYTYSKPKIDYKNPEDIDRLNETLDDYIYEIISKIPMDQRLKFYKNINQSNISLFFNEILVKETPELYSIFMNNYFGNDKYQELFSDEYQEGFEFLKDCPELFEQLDSFPTNQKIDVTKYYGFINSLAKNVYSKLPDENKGKAVLSYIRNTKNELETLFADFRNDFVESTLPKDYVFGKQDYEEIIAELDRIINERTIDSIFFKTILNHSTDELIAQFTMHLIERAYSILKEQNDDKTINFFNDALGRNISSVDFSTIENAEEIIKLFIDNNMGQALDKSLALSNHEDVIRYFENFISKQEDVMASKNGIISAFIKNLDFETYNISSKDITLLVNYMIDNRDSKSLKFLLERCQEGYRQPIVNYILEHYNNIPEDESYRDNRALFLIEAVKASEAGAIDIFDGRNVILDAIGLDVNDADKIIEKSEEIVRNFYNTKFDSRDLVSAVLSKMKDEDALVVYNIYIYGPYALTEDNRFSGRSIYSHYIVTWLNQLSPDSIKKFISESSYLKDKFIQEALKDSEQYSNIVTAIESLRAETVLPDMHEIDERIKKGDVLNPNEVDEYFKKLELIRLKEGIIPEKYCDFAIRNTILAKGQEYDIESNYNTIYPLCVVDKTKHVLKSEGIDDITVFADNKETTNLGTFIDSAKELNLSASIILAMQKGVYDIINTIFHEVRHAVQYNDINNNTLKNISEYDMIKEQLIRKADFIFYDINYDSITAEIDARVEGRKKMYQYLQSLGISIEQILEGDTEYNKKAKMAYEEYVHEETDRLENSNKEFKVNFSDVKSLDSIFDELITKHPKLIQENPILKYEYNEDGTRKSSIEMLQEYEEMISNPDYVEPQFVIQEHLIIRKYNGNVDSQRNLMLRDAELLQNFMPKTEKGKKIMNNIINCMTEYTNQLHNNARQLIQSSNKDDAQKILSDSNKISSAISRYLDRKMNQELMSMSDIDSMVSDEQRAYALSQMKDNQKSRAKEDIRTQQSTANAEPYKNETLNNPSTDDELDL